MQLLSKSKDVQLCFFSQAAQFIFQKGCIFMLIIKVKQLEEELRTQEAEAVIKEILNKILYDIIEN